VPFASAAVTLRSLAVAVGTKKARTRRARRTTKNRRSAEFARGWKARPRAAALRYGNPFVNDFFGVRHGFGIGLRFKFCDSYRT